MDIATLKAKGIVRPLMAPFPIQAAFPFGMGTSGLHEIAEATHGDFPALTGFALAAAQVRRGTVFWVSQTGPGRDHGDVPEAALAAFRRAPVQRVCVRTGKLAHALWAIEEAVVSGAVALVVAEIAEADFTATRRLALASGRHGVPVILLMPYQREGATAATARWRVKAKPSARNPFDAQAPGHARWHAVLERCRIAPQLAGQAYDLEWNDETLSLSLAAGLAARPAAPRPVPLAKAG